MAKAELDNLVQLVGRIVIRRHESQRSRIALRLRLQCALRAARGQIGLSQPALAQPRPDSARGKMTGSATSGARAVPRLLWSAYQVGSCGAR